MNHMATLAKRLKISSIIVAGIVVQMRGGEDYPGGPSAADERRGCAHLQQPSMAILPSPDFFAPPAAIPQMGDYCPMRPVTLLASSTRTFEPDLVGQLRPVNRIKPTVLRTDRHQERPFTRLAKRAKVEFEQLVA